MSTPISPVGFLFASGTTAGTTYMHVQVSREGKSPKRLQTVEQATLAHPCASRHLGSCPSRREQLRRGDQEAMTADL